MMEMNRVPVDKDGNQKVTKIQEVIQYTGGVAGI
jgi:hypothetical protein